MALMHGAKVLFGKALRAVHAGEQKLASRQAPAPPAISLHTSAFGDGTVIPRKYSGEGPDVSPELAWSGVPAQAMELVMVCEDPDAPMPRPYLHWLAWGISPATTRLPEGVPATREPGIGGMKQGKNDSGRIGYMGPMPPPGHGVHHYHFQLFALDARLNVSANTDRDDLMKAMADHVIAEGELIGTYERR